MNNDFFEALKLLKEEKNIDLCDLTEKIKNAIAVAIKKNYGNMTGIFIDLDICKNVFSVFITKNVVDEVTDDLNEILLDEALKYDVNAKVGFPVMIKLDPKKFGRIAALSAKHIIKQGIREGEKNQIYNNLKGKEHMVVSAIVSKLDPRRLNASLLIDSSEVILPRSEQIPNEQLVEGDVIKVYISEVSRTEKGPKILISRTHTELVKQLFEMEVPEIKRKIIEIKSVAREAGSRTKVAVSSYNENIDPVGSCVGAQGLRVNKIVNELNGEKIDIVKYSDDFVEYISNALAPATISCVMADPLAEKNCYVVVPDKQLSLAIGNRGQNVRLSAKLTGWKIDIKPESMLEEVRNEIEIKRQELEERKLLEEKKLFDEELCDRCNLDSVESKGDLESADGLHDFGKELKDCKEDDIPNDMNSNDVAGNGENLSDGRDSEESDDLMFFDFDKEIKVSNGAVDGDLNNDFENDDDNDVES